MAAAAALDSIRDASSASPGVVDGRRTSRPFFSKGFAQWEYLAVWRVFSYADHPWRLRLHCPM